MNIEDRLQAMGLTLPEPPPSGGIYKPVREAAGLLYVSGHGPTVGSICMILVPDDTPSAAAARVALLAAAEEYLIHRGMKTIYAGAFRGSVQLFVGFSGPIGLSCVPAGSPSCEFLIQNGYTINNRPIRMQMSLEQYRPPVILTATRWRDKSQIVFERVPKAQNWWDALIKANDEWLETLIIVEPNDRPVARILVRIPALAKSHHSDEAKSFRQKKYAHIVNYHVRPDYLARGVFSYAIGETLRELVVKDEILELETVISDESSHLIPSFRAFGLQEIDQGAIFIKRLE